MNRDDIVVLGFGEGLKFRRKQKQLTQDEIAPKIGVSQSTLSSWEKQRYPPKDDMGLDELAKLFDASMDDIRLGRVYLLDDQPSNTSIAEWNEQVGFARRIYGYLPKEQLPMVAEFAREMSLLPPAHRKDVWRLVRISIRTMQVVTEKARVLGAPPPELEGNTVHEESGEYTVDEQELA